MIGNWYANCMLIAIWLVCKLLKYHHRWSCPGTQTAAGETSGISSRVSSFSSLVIINTTTSIFTINTININNISIFISTILLGIRITIPGIGIMILIIPYAFASVIKQLQMEEEIARQVLKSNLVASILVNYMLTRSILVFIITCWKEQLVFQEKRGDSEEQDDGWRSHQWMSHLMNMSICFQMIKSNLLEIYFSQSVFLFVGEGEDFGLCSIQKESGFLFTTFHNFLKLFTTLLLKTITL